MATVQPDDCDYDCSDKFMGPWAGAPMYFADRQEFVSTVKARLAYEQSNKDAIPFYLTALWRWLFLTGAVDCCAALLEGDIPCCTLNVNETILRGKHPLDDAAMALCYDFVKMFLDHGARTDVPSTRGLLPISTALKTCGRKLDEDIDQSSKTSFINLFIALCHPEMKEPLDVIRLLACATREVGKVFNDYAKEGNLVEMAVLGIVAMDRVMPHKDASVVRDSILQEYGSLAGAELQLSVKRVHGIELVDKFKAKKAALASALTLLDFFEKAGDAIGLYFRSRKTNMPKGRVVKDVEAILGKKGVFMKDIEFIDIDCKNSQIKEDAKALLVDKPQQYPGLPLELRPGMYPYAKWKSSRSRSPGTRAEQTRISHAHWSPPALRSDHLPVRCYSAYNEPMEVQSKGLTAATPRVVRVQTKSSKQVAAYLALALKMGMRRV